MQRAARRGCTGLTHQRYRQCCAIPTLCALTDRVSAHCTFHAPVCACTCPAASLAPQWCGLCWPRCHHISPVPASSERLHGDLSSRQSRPIPPLPRRDDVVSCRSSQFHAPNLLLVSQALRRELRAVGADFWTCPGRDASRPFDANGLPALPEPLPVSAYQVEQRDAVIRAAINTTVVQQCDFQLTFPTPDGRDPLLHETFAKWGDSVLPEWSLMHVRWASSTWWCSHPDVVGVFADLDTHPYQAMCRDILKAH